MEHKYYCVYCGEGFNYEPRHGGLACEDCYCYECDELHENCKCDYTDDIECEDPGLVCNFKKSNKQIYEEAIMEYNRRYAFDKDSEIYSISTEAFDITGKDISGTYFSVRDYTQGYGVDGDGISHTNLYNIIEEIRKNKF